MDPIRDVCARWSFILDRHVTREEHMCEGKINCGRGRLGVDEGLG